MAVHRSMLNLCKLRCVLSRTHLQLIRHASSDTFKFSDLTVQLCQKKDMKKKPDPTKLVFGKEFSDHMFKVLWTLDKGWGKPEICPLQNISLHPGAKVFHYASEVFEGLKAYRDSAKQVLLFRPEMNAERMINSVKRCGLPSFDRDEFLKCLKKFVQIDKEWVPYSNSCTLYIRPTAIGTEPTLGVQASKEAMLYVIAGPVGPYFAGGLTSVSLLADPTYIRAFPGGCGDVKMGSNYAPTILAQKAAEKQGFQQILWLFGADNQLTEVGTMNIFIVVANEKGEKELVTPPLDGLILPGVTRQSLLDLARDWKEFKVSERKITMDEILFLSKKKQLLEIFGSGTACVVSPVRSIYFKGVNIDIPTLEQKEPLTLRFLKTLTDIQFGRIKHPWSVPVE